MICVPSKDSDQPGHSSSLIRGFTVHTVGSWGPSVSSCGQRRLIRLADVQADLSLPWAQYHFDGFVMSRLISPITPITSQANQVCETKNRRPPRKFTWPSTSKMWLHYMYSEWGLHQYSYRSANPTSNPTPNSSSRYTSETVLKENSGNSRDLCANDVNLLKIHEK